MTRAEGAFVGFEGFTVRDFIGAFGWKERAGVNLLLRNKYDIEAYPLENKGLLSKAMKGARPFNSHAREVCSADPREGIRRLKALELPAQAVLAMVGSFRASVDNADRGHFALPYACRVLEACECLASRYFERETRSEQAECVARIVWYLMGFYFNNGKRPLGTFADSELTSFLSQCGRRGMSDGSPRIKSPPAFNPEYYQPRTDEREELRSRLERYGRVVVTAMGGVGKTALVRDYIASYGREYSKCVYVVCSRSRPSLAEAIGDDDDRCVAIEGLQKGSRSSLSYAKEKLRILGQQERRLLLVIDNYDGLLADDPLYPALQNTPCTQLITSRWKQRDREMYVPYMLRPITEPSMLRRICEGILQLKGYTPPWDGDLEALVGYAHGNIKALEVLLGQMCASFVTPRELRLRLEQAGVHRLGLTEGVGEEGQSAARILSMLFDVSDDAFSGRMKRILLDLSMVPLTGIPVPDYMKLAELPGADLINALIDRSWVELEDRRIHLHPIVAEAVLSQVTDQERSVLPGSAFFRNIGAMADRNWAISARERALIAPIVRNVLREKPVVDETTLPLLSDFCRLAFDDTSDVGNDAMDTLIRIEEYWRGRDQDRHLYASYLIVEYVPGVLCGDRTAPGAGYRPPASFDVRAFAGRWQEHIARLEREGRYALAEQCRMIGVRHIPANKGNEAGLRRLKEELDAIRLLCARSMETQEDLSYLRQFPGLYGYSPRYLQAGVRHFSSRILFRLADSGYLPSDAYDQAYTLVKQAQEVLLCVDQYQDYHPCEEATYRRVRADILCTEGHILLMQGRYREAAAALEAGIGELNGFLVPLSRRYLIPYRDMVRAMAGLDELGELSAEQQRLQTIYANKIREIEAGF